MLILRLTLRQLLVRRTRTALTLLAIGFAVSLVVAVTSGFASMTAVALRLTDRYMGSTDVFVTARDVQRKAFAASVADDLRADPRVKRVTARFETAGPITDLKGKARLRTTAFVGLAGGESGDDANAANLALVAGKWFEGTRGNYVVLNDVVARNIANTPEALQRASDPTTMPSAKEGDHISLPGPNGALKLEVVGVIHQPEIAGESVFVPLDTLRDWATSGGGSGAAKADGGKVLTRAMVELKPGSDLPGFEKEWTDRLARLDPTIKVRLARTNKDNIEKNLSGLQLVSALGVSISLVAAACIVFTTLSMGVAERQRQLAMLRAIGAARGQIGALVICEGMLLALLGVSVGVPLGLFWVKGLVWRYDDFFTEGVVVSAAGISYALGACILTALVATILPAWQATRVSPLEAMVPLANPGSGRWPWRMAVAGVLLACVEPLLMGGTPAVIRWWDPSASDGLIRGIQFFGHFIVGVPLTMIGFFMLSPTVVRLTEAGLAPVVARLLQLPVGLIRQQLGAGSAGVWRSAGTACALMVGLAVLVVMQVQGTSAIGSWKLPTKFPDVFIVHKGMGGLGAAEVEKLRATPGIRPSELLPIAIASPQFGSNFLMIAGMAGFAPESTLFFGCDPELANKMVELEFREGTAETALPLLKQSGYIMVTEEFRQLKGLHVGDKLALKNTKGVSKDFTIAAVIWSPGLDVLVSLNDLGSSFEQRTAFSVFGSLEDARNFFGADEISVFAANVDIGISRESMTKRIQQEVGKMGLAAYDIRQIKANIEKALNRLLLMASSVAFAALLVASLGVTNTVMASIRSRRWQFGVLRSVGVTRGQLVRVVLAESGLLALAAIVLGFGCGTWLTIGSRGMLRSLMGAIPPVVIPWGMLGAGAGFVALVAICASAFPARATSRQPVLDLLQTGRSGT